MTSPATAKPKNNLRSLPVLRRIKTSDPRLRPILIPLDFSGKSRQARPKSGRPGSPSPAILPPAHRPVADPIGRTTPGRSGVRALFVGPTAAPVRRHATYPVLSVRRP
jgi:hypothetical protein